MVITTKVTVGERREKQGHAKQDSVSHMLLFRDQSKAVCLTLITSSMMLAQNIIQAASIYHHGNGLSLNKEFCKRMHLI